MTASKWLATLWGVRCIPAHIPARLLLLLLALPGLADGIAYEVEINAPSAVEGLLEQNLGIVRWRGSDYIDREQLERLYEAIPREVETLLAPLGYFKPKVISSLKSDDNGWRVEVTVEPGEEAIVYDVDLQVEGGIREEPDFRRRWAELIEVWPLPIGAPFTQAAWDAAKRRGSQALIIDRFPAARIKESRAEVDPERGAAELSVLFDSGPRFTFGPMQVNGLQRYPLKLVEHMAGFRRGEGYSQQKLLDFQTALQSTPYFSSVFIDMPLDASQPDDVPLRVELVEAPTRKLDLGIGFDTDKGPRGSVGYRYSNLRDLGWIGTTALDLQRDEQTFDIGIELPPDAKRYSYSGTYNLERKDVAGLETWTHTVSVQRTRTRGDIEVSQALQYTRERAQQDDEPVSITRALTPVQTWTRRKLDNLNDPRRGTIMSWQLVGATSALFSDANFVRGWGRIAWYYPAGSEGTWLLRGEAGQVLADNAENVPTKWLFRAGGANSVRGYKFETLGVPDGTAIVGGRVLATASIEYQHRIVGRWRAAVFADAGGAAFDWNNYKAFRGYGIGTRWISPVGPFALDFARGVDQRRNRIHFSVGLGF